MKYCNMKRFMNKTTLREVQAQPMDYREFCLLHEKKFTKDAKGWCTLSLKGENPYWIEKEDFERMYEMCLQRVYQLHKPLDFVQSVIPMTQEFFYNNHRDVGMDAPFDVDGYFVLTKDRDESFWIDDVMFDAEFTYIKKEAENSLKLKVVERYAIKNIYDSIHEGGNEYFIMGDDDMPLTFANEEQAETHISKLPQAIYSIEKLFIKVKNEQRTENN